MSALLGTSRSRDKTRFPQPRERLFPVREARRGGSLVAAAASLNVIELNLPFALSAALPFEYPLPDAGGLAVRL